MTPVEVLYTCHDGRLKYYTREHADPKIWPAVPKATRTQLNRIESVIETTAADYKIKGDPLTKAILRAKLDAVLNKKKKKPAETLFDKMLAITDDMESGKILTPKKRRYAASTIKSIRNSINRLKEFDPGMRRETVSLETYNRFLVWANENNWSRNYIGTIIKNWKVVGNLVGGNDIYGHRDFKKLQEDADNIYLTEEEIQKMIKAVVPTASELARDWFIIGWATGLRVSDLLSLTNRNYSNGNIIVANEKTEQKVIIPAKKVVKDIIKKYKGFPPKISAVELNRQIKMVAERAGIDDDILITITKGGNREDRYLKKWQAVKSHTGRRSLITNAGKSGVHDQITMKITGIKSPNTLKKYNKMSPEEAAKIASGLDFFK